jgi:hypothetical protein
MRIAAASSPSPDPSAAPSPRDLRRRAGLTLIKAAVGAGTSENTVRLYDANREAVTIGPRSKLDRFYADVARELDSKAASSP